MLFSLQSEAQHFHHQSKIYPSCQMTSNDIWYLTNKCTSSNLNICFLWIIIPYLTQTWYSMIFLSTHCPLGNVAVAPMRMWENLTNEKSTLIQIMAWCHEATITWANTDPDLCCDMATLSHNELVIRMYMKIPFHLSHSFRKRFFSLQLCIVTCPVSDRTALWHIASLYTGQIKAAVWVPEFVWSSLLALCSSPENIFLRKVDNILASERSLKWTNSWNLIFDFTSNDHNRCL